MLGLCGDMSVAFAAPRQRGKGEITPAAIQKVRHKGGTIVIRGLVTHYLWDMRIERGMGSAERVGLSCEWRPQLYLYLQNNDTSGQLFPP